MPKYFRSSSFGLMRETSDIESGFDEVRFSNEEYANLCIEQTKSRQEQQRLASMAHGLRQQLESAKRENEALQQQLRQAQTENHRLNEEKNEIQSALQQQERLNANLLRISRERANAARGLKPQKERSGYVVLSSTQAVERVSKSRNAGVWRSVVQTPYDASLPLETVRPQIAQELKEKIFGRLGIVYMANDLENGKIVTVLSGREGTMIADCAIYRLTYRVNYRAGLWEMVWHTTKELTVPEEFRPAEKKKRQA